MLCHCHTALCLYVLCYIFIMRYCSILGSHSCVCRAANRFREYFSTKHLPSPPAKYLYLSDAICLPDRSFFQKLPHQVFHLHLRQQNKSPLQIYIYLNNQGMSISGLNRPRYCEINTDGNCIVFVITACMCLALCYILIPLLDGLGLFSSLIYRSVAEASV